MKKFFDLNAFLLGSICALLFHIAYMGFTYLDEPKETSPKSQPKSKVVMYAGK